MARTCVTCGLYDCAEPSCGEPKNGMCCDPDCHQIHRNPDYCAECKGCKLTVYPTVTGRMSSAGDIGMQVPRRVQYVQPPLDGKSLDAVFSRVTERMSAMFGIPSQALQDGVPNSMEEQQALIDRLDKLAGNNR